jgi:hypothetical protein
MTFIHKGEDSSLLLSLRSFTEQLHLIITALLANLSLRVRLYTRCHRWRREDVTVVACALLKTDRDHPLTCNSTTTILVF